MRNFLLKFYCHLNSTEIWVFRVNMAVRMAPIRSARQNAENALFEKRAILVEFSGQKIKNLPLCRNGVIFSFSFLASKILSHLSLSHFSTSSSIGQKTRIFKYLFCFFETDFPGFIYTIWEWTGAQLVVHLVLWPCPSRGSGQIRRISKFNLF